MTYQLAIGLGSVFLLLAEPHSIYAQAPTFSQYYASGIYLNPALAGLEKDTYLGINYRSQWSNLSLPFNTFQFSFIQPITKPGARRKHVGGYGLSYLNDAAGANREFVTQAISVAYAHNLHLNKHGNNIISIAAQVGASQQRVNFNRLQWSSQYSSISGFDQSLPGEVNLLNDQTLQPMMNGGIMWYYTNKQRNLSHLSTSYYNGLAVSGLLQTNSFYLQGNGNVSVLYKLHGGLSSTYSRKVDFSPNYMIQLQDENIQFNVGMYMGYSLNPQKGSKGSSTKVLVGAWYRWQDSFIVSTGLASEGWNVGFSFDNNIFAMSKTFGYGSAFELSLAYRITNKNAYKRFSSPLI